jgi:hypothetical protein
MMFALRNGGGRIVVDDYNNFLAERRSTESDVLGPEISLDHHICSTADLVSCLFPTSRDKMCSIQAEASNGLQMLTTTGTQLHHHPGEIQTSDLSWYYRQHEGIKRMLKGFKAPRTLPSGTCSICYMNSSFV